MPGFLFIGPCPSSHPSPDEPKERESFLWQELGRSHTLSQEGNTGQDLSHLPQGSRVPSVTLGQVQGRVAAFAPPGGARMGQHSRFDPGSSFGAGQIRCGGHRTLRCDGHRTSRSDGHRSLTLVWRKMLCGKETLRVPRAAPGSDAGPEEPRWDPGGLCPAGLSRAAAGGGQVVAPPRKSRPGLLGNLRRAGEK